MPSENLCARCRLLGPQPAAQAVIGGVRQFQRLGVIPEACHRDERAENLLLKHRVAGSGFDYCRFQVIAFFEFPVIRLFASREYFIVFSVCIRRYS